MSGGAATPVMLLTLGGTIAAKKEQSAAGVSPRIAPGELLEGLGVDVRVKTRALACRPSIDLTLADVAALAEAVEEAHAGGMGVVISQGTDTLEESAFALSLMMKTEGSIVFTAAMRPADQPGADGPANLAAALKVAICQEARELGPMVVLGDEIFAGRWIRKVHTSAPRAFASGAFGPIGYVVEDRVRIEFHPKPPPFSLRMGKDPSSVSVLDAGPELDPKAIASLSGTGFQGLVLAGCGGGHLPSCCLAALESAAHRIPVVLASRAGAGEILRRTYDYPGGELSLQRLGLIPAGPLDASKARVLLRLLLSNGATIPEVRDAFSAL